MLRNTLSYFRLNNWEFFIKVKRKRKAIMGNEWLREEEPGRLY